MDKIKICGNCDCPFVGEICPNCGCEVWHFEDADMVDDDE